MLDDAAYRRIRLNFFRMHRQFVSGNTRRARYDYFMLVCGPLSAEAQLRSPDGAASAFANDGTLKKKKNFLGRLEPESAMPDYLEGKSVSVGCGSDLDTTRCSVFNLRISLM